MDEQPLTLAHLPSSDAFQKLIAAIAGFCGSRTVSVLVSTSVGRSHLDVHGVPAANLHNHPKITEFLATLTSRPYLTLKEIIVTPGRDHETNKSWRIVYSATDAIADTIIIQPLNTTTPLDPAVALTAIDSLTQHFTFVDKSTLLQAALPLAQQQSLAFYETALRDFGAKIAQLGTVSADQIRESQRILQEKISSLEAQYAQKTDLLEKDYNTKNTQLSHREEAVQKRESDILFRARTATRRDIYDKSLERFESQLASMTISKATSEKRLPVHAVYIAILAVLGAAATTILTLIVRGHVTGNLIYIILSACTFGFIFFAIAYSRFVYQYFADLARAEFSMRKLIADTCRANYVAELFLETKENTKVRLPDILLVNFTNNLFSVSSDKDAVQHPVEQLLAIAGKTRKVKVSTKGGELKLKD